jgi:predicted enzyme related to lactoylglutathione lyase
MAEQPGAGTVFSLFPDDTDYFAPSTKPFMLNLAVDDLAGILELAKAHGVEPVRTFDDQPNGRYAHIVDPEGTTLELWEPAPMG